MAELRHTRLAPLVEDLAAGLAGFRRAYPDPSANIAYEMRFDRVVARR